MLIDEESNEQAALQAQRRDEDSRAHEQLQRVALGLSIQQFLAGDVGRYLTQRAEQERSVLLEKFITIPPNDEHAIREAQMRVAIIDRWQEWLGEALNAGHVAEQQFINEGKVD